VSRPISRLGRRGGDGFVVVVAFPYFMAVASPVAGCVGPDIDCVGVGFGVSVLMVGTGCCRCGGGCGVGGLEVDLEGDGDFAVCGVESVLAVDLFGLVSRDGGNDCGDDD